VFFHGFGVDAEFKKCEKKKVNLSQDKLKKGTTSKWIPLNEIFLSLF